VFITHRRNTSTFTIEDHTWERYEGEFLADKWHGLGTLFFTNGDKFYGEFRNDLIEGRGSYYRTDNTVIAGMWQDNCLVKLL